MVDITGLLSPLKNALGNAYKHGNRRGRAKSISVEIVLTRKGALIAMTDEGAYRPRNVRPLPGNSQRCKGTEQPCHEVPLTTVDPNILTAPGKLMSRIDSRASALRTIGSHKVRNSISRSTE